MVTQPRLRRGGIPIAPLAIIRMTTRFTNYSCRELIYQFETGILIVPDYQRAFVWPIGKQRKLITDMLKSRPVPAFLFSEQVVHGVKTSFNIIDGRQRLGTISKFFNNLFTVVVDGAPKHFKDLDVEARCRFESINLAASVQSNCSPKEEAEIYESINSGMSLTAGERIKPCDDTPFFKYSEKMLAKYEPELSRLLGKLDKTCNRHGMLMHAIGMMAGATFGQSHITTLFPAIYHLTQTMTDEMLEQHVDVTDRNMKRLIRVWTETAQDAGRLPCTTKWGNKRLWGIGTFTGYLIHTFWDIEKGLIDEETTLKDLSVFLADCMRDPTLFDKMQSTRRAGQALNRGRIGITRMMEGSQLMIRYAVEGVAIFDAPAVAPPSTMAVAADVATTSFNTL
jgi:hypothetical protein